MFGEANTIDLFGLGYPSVADRNGNVFYPHPPWRLLRITVGTVGVSDGVLRRSY